jgi:hypothetical protein
MQKLLWSGLAMTLVGGTFTWTAFMAEWYPNSMVGQWAGAVFGHGKRTCLQRIFYLPRSGKTDGCSTETRARNADVPAIPMDSPENWDLQKDLQLIDLLRLSEAQNPIRPNLEEELTFCPCFWFCVPPAQ